ncbi:hypothetical protein [Bifidobacterium myosotis]|uniref:hypothetical protein n=1 Tax=Bifidobacterium myosotis TaxID=1630166 RepID=UPI00168AFAE7|nr:hypothetical protein [Bifidobacterium myosotis]
MSNIGALLLCVLVVAVGGFNVRYITDWAWLLAICDYAPATVHGAQALIQLRTLFLPN